MINPLSLIRNTRDLLDQLVGKADDADASEDHEEQPADDAKEGNHADEDRDRDRESLLHAGGQLRGSHFLRRQKVLRCDLVLPVRNYAKKRSLELRISISSGFISMRNVLFADTVKDSISISVSLMSKQKIAVNAATTTITPSVQEQADRQRSPVGGCSISIVS